MKDYLIKALALNDEIRAYGICATAAVQEAVKRHDTYSGSTLALGKTMIGALLLGATLKGEDKITVKILGDGPTGSIVVDSNGHGTVKGYIQQPHVYLQPDENNQPSLPATIGRNGVLSVIKDLGLKEPFSGQVPLTAGDISQDFTYYMALSEQVPSAIGLSVILDEDGGVTAAGGFMIQVLPGAKESTIAQVENGLAEANNFGQKILAEASPEELLNDLIGSPVSVLKKMQVSFACDCSKEKFGDAMISLGEKEILAMIEEDHGAEAVCRFCNNHYQYSEDDLLELAAAARQKKGE
ncbi:Hsp33 family molecular chaperone HslO [Enterococcus timonensis]|uniref:Hsp33 family molecular chaperone HslO n=1 Tax=Enterococcus timonensis TaxID=1852364 RepID=UPI0008D9C6D9|nr:Hsp33 family molecular chaperone HslO [Enterococcus timonensis]